MAPVISFFIGLLVIALIITVHETGHFFVSRLVGVNVETFAIGWGKAIKKWTSKGVEYRINIFPLGGYCRLDARSLFSVHPLKRISVFLAGSLFNLILAFLIFALFFSFNYQETVYPNKIVVSSDYPSLFEDLNQSASPFVTGDQILAINGKKVDDFSDIQRLLALVKKGKTTHFEVLRDAEKINITTSGVWDKEQKKNLYGISYFLEPKVDFIQELSPEALSGLSNGDTIVALNGQPIRNSFDLLSLFSENPSFVELQVVTEDQKSKVIEYYPTKNSEGAIVISFGFHREIKMRSGQNFVNSLLNALKETLSTFSQTFTLLPTLIMGKSSLNGSVAGPLRISYIIGSMRSVGLRALLHVTASVSASLAAANFLPLPGLDGGSIVIGIIELFRKKQLSQSIYYRFQSIGLLFLLILMIFVIGSDLRFFFSYL